MAGANPAFPYDAWGADGPDLAVPTSDYRPLGLAGPLVKTALDLEAAGKTAEAWAWLQRAFALVPENSDLLYLYARLGGNDRNSLRHAALERALALNNFSVFRPAEAAELWYGLSLIMGEPAAARRDSDTRFTPAQLTNAPSLLYHVVLLRARTDDIAGARDLLARGLRAKPGDLWFHAAQASIDTSPSLAASLAFGRADPGQRGWTVLARALADRLPPGEERLAVVEALMDRGLARPRDHALRFTDAVALGGDASALLRDFLAGQGMASADAVAAVGDFLATEERAALRRELETALGRGERALARDRDHDGYAEELYRFRDGALVEWARDQDQDGLWDWLAEFDGGQPRSLVAGNPRRGSVTARDYGSNYPYAALTWQDTPRHTFAWRHGNRQGEFPFVDLPPTYSGPLEALTWRFYPETQAVEPADLAWDAWWVDTWARQWPDDDTLGLLSTLQGTATLWAPEDRDQMFGPLMGSLSRPRRLADFRPARTEPNGQFALEEGRVTLGRHDTLGRGYFDKHYLFDGAGLLLALRDTDSRGEFNAVEEYDADGLREVRFGTGQWTYRVLPRLGIHDWDLDANGTIDLREIQDVWTTLWRGWSTKGNGVFDVDLDLPPPVRGL